MLSTCSGPQLYAGVGLGSLACISAHISVLWYDILCVKMYVYIFLLLTHAFSLLSPSLSLILGG